MQLLLFSNLELFPPTNKQIEAKVWFCTEETCCILLFLLDLSWPVKIIIQFNNYFFPPETGHGLRTPRESFFKNLELLGLGRHFGLKCFEAFEARPCPFILILSWFCPDFILILSWFHLDFILILSRFFENSLYPNFILILS